MDSNTREEEEGLIHPRVSGSDWDDHETESFTYELDEFEDEARYFNVTQRPRWWKTKPRSHKSGYLFLPFTTYHSRRPRSVYIRTLAWLLLIPYAILSSIVICGIFFPSYTYLPERYLELHSRVRELGQTANIHNEKIFIAASLYDHEGEVLSGRWAGALLELIDILGKDNVFLSIYENDPDEKARAALHNFAKNVTCQSELVTEHIDLAELPRISTPDGSQRLKRIAFLADVRNRALRPLENASSPAYDTRFDKLLYLNDVVFDPVDAANLLFSTNVDESTGKTQYKAACAVDFINPFKFYDTYATRDLEGYNMGVPFYPWFTGAGAGMSRRDVLEQKDAVRVKSCWGGMVAFEAKWFQGRLIHDSARPKESLAVTSGPPSTIHTDMGRAAAEMTNSSLRFRADKDTYWDGSECCLIHADLMAMDSSINEHDTGIYMNPYIRVAYSANVLPWLSFTKRFERLYTPIHSIINWISDRPSYNPRQFQTPGEEVIDRVWVWNPETQVRLRQGEKLSPNELRGSFEDVRRTARPGGYCGLRKLSYINENAAEGEPHWITEKLPLTVDYKRG